MSASPATSTYSPYFGPPWARLAVVAAILAGSGVARSWQERRVESVLERGRTSPFPLDGLPTAIGPWEGQSVAMDPRIVRISGSTDIITRHYVDRRTGLGLDLIVAYGPVSEMFLHTPENCYPSAGYGQMPGVFERRIAVEGMVPSVVPSRSLAFAKGEGGLLDAHEVYYSLWYDGGWTTEVPGSRASRRFPGMYKVQVSRRLASRERRDVDDPCEPFLAAIFGEIEARMVGKRPATTLASH